MNDVIHPLVLIVDDDASIRELFSHTLGEEGFRVAVAADGREATAALERQIPSAVVLDMAMPNASGLAVLQRIRERPETTHLPVIVVTGIDPHDELWGGREWGWDMYLSKPVDLTELTAAVREVTSRA